MTSQQNISKFEPTEGSTSTDPVAPPGAGEAADFRGVFFTTAGPSSAPRALATLQSAATVAGVQQCVVLAAPSIAIQFGEFEVLMPADVLPDNSLVPDIFSDDETVAFAEPFALARVLERHQEILRLAPGSFVVARPIALAQMLAGADMALTAPIVPTPRYSGVPHLAFRESGQSISTLVVGLKRSASHLLAEWQAAVGDSPFDPSWIQPSEVTNRLLVSLVGTPGVCVEGSATLASWHDYAAIESGAASAELPAIIDTGDLWDVVGREGSGEQEAADIEYRTIDLRVHDATPLEHIGQAIRRAEGQTEPSLGPVLYEGFIRDIRLASDPLGLRWGSGSSELFGEWLFARNRRGTTRIADLFWYSSPEIARHFPEARSDPSRYRAWSDGTLRTILGFDPFGEVGQDVGPGDWVFPIEPESNLKNAIAWRWNTVRGLLPDISSRKGRGGSRREDVADGPVRAIEPSRAQEIERRGRDSLTRTPAAWGDVPRSLSLIGCFRTESGLGQAARASVAAVRHLGIPFTHIDTSDTFAARNHVDVGLSRDSHAAIGDVNLIHSNAAELITTNDGVLRHRLGGRFNAAMWFWEARNLPPWKLAAFDRIDELWVASEYLKDVFDQYERVPVHVIGLPSELPRDRTPDRAALGWGDDEFVFLFVYDAFSSRLRKNPEKALRAFIEAFGPTFENVRFVVKVSNLSKFPADSERLAAFADVSPTIEVIDAYYEQDQIYDLMAAADVYVSLHAAEGYGLTLLEAMSMGTPVICTGYSGNLDFTDDDNSWLVDYTLVETVEQSGPYPPGSIWADPSVAHAAALMRRAASNPDEVRAKSGRASEAASRAASLDRYSERLGQQLRRVM